MKRRTRAETEEDLRWYFADSKAELGLRGLPIEPQAGGPGSKNDNPGPDAAMLKAVRRQRCIAAAVDELNQQNRGILAACYECRRVDPELAAAWGNSARIIQRSKAQNQAERHALVGLVQAAHDAYAAVRERHDREHVEAVRDARRAGQARRAVMLADTREAALRRGEREAIELAAWLEDMDLVVDGHVDWSVVVSDAERAGL